MGMRGCSPGEEGGETPSGVEADSSSRNLVLGPGWRETALFHSITPFSSLFHGAEARAWA